ncbi:MAG TPA: hypothetical protein VNN22_14870 [Verrucomicrobiae bacterium]|nr:hypothetical protein [Verrucomicrobiae bacterium]
MIRTFFLTLTLACSLPCMAESGQYFLRTFGSIELDDATNQVTITTSQSDSHKNSAFVVWRSGRRFDIPLTCDGWFVYAEDARHIWVFTGEAIVLMPHTGMQTTNAEDYCHVWVFNDKTIQLTHHTDKQTTNELSAEFDKVCPKVVRDALPESFRKKYFP